MDSLFAPKGSIKDQDEAVCLFDSFSDILKGLNKWEVSVSNNAARPLHWYQEQTTEASKIPAVKIPCIWFSGITMANACTHIWSFRIICLYEMERLAFSFPQLSFAQLKMLGELGIKSVPQGARNLMSQICQSMEYLLQEEMKLFGPASAVLPLQVAYAIATIDPNRHRAEVTVIRNIIDRVVRKGLQSFPLHIFEKNLFMHRWETLKYISGK